MFRSIVLLLVERNNRGKTWLRVYKTYVKLALLYACEAWRQTTQKGIEKLKAVQRIAMRMAGGLGWATTGRS